MQPLQVLFIRQVFGKVFRGLVQILLVQNLPQFVKLLVIQAFHVAGSGIIEILFQFFHVVVHQGHGLFLGHGTRIFQMSFDLIELSAAQIRLEREHLRGHSMTALVFQHALDGGPALLIIQYVVIFFQ